MCRYVVSVTIKDFWNRTATSAAVSVVVSNGVRPVVTIAGSKTVTTTRAKKLQLDGSATLEL